VPILIWVKQKHHTASRHAARPALAASGDCRFLAAFFMATSPIVAELPALRGNGTAKK